LSQPLVFFVQNKTKTIMSKREKIDSFLAELEAEAQTTRKMLERIPEEHYDWKPHEKSMTVKQLATHIAELPNWITMTLTTDGLDFATTPYNPVNIEGNAQMMKYFERSLADGRDNLRNATDDTLQGNWILRDGDQIYDNSPKDKVVRNVFCQIVHHRAQMGVFLRLLNVPIPGSYGPSADEK
jgi:uncharacterized damage-inducible protein DinB